MAPSLHKEPLSSEALTNTSIINRVLDTVVGVWDLEDTRERAPESLESYTYKVDGAESVVGTDERTKVHSSEFGPGGKYRSIVKLMLHYEGQGNRDVWSMGTGWLIAPDLLVTAGHCSYDWTHKLGKLTKVKAFIGYNGKGSIPDPNVQFRSGKRVACPAEWLKGPTMTYDVSFILVDQPFEGITPIKYSDTPARGNMTLGVVGYPGDLERGEHMYEHFVDCRFDLAENGKMLTYEIDTYGGNSGSAVLRQNDLVSIGVHAYGGALNKASVIGPLGNVFSDYITAIRSPVRGKKTHQGIHFQSIPTGSTAHLHNGSHHGYSNGTHHNGTRHNGNHYNGTHHNGTHHNIVRSSSYNGTNSHALRRSPSGYLGQESVQLDDQEGFFDDVGAFIKKGIKVSAPIVSGALGTAAPFLGPIGAPIACLAGTAFGVAGKLCESGTESFGDDADAVVLDGHAERAVMGEAALQVFMNMDKQTLQEEGLFDVFTSVIKTMGPIVKKAAPHVLNAVMPAALNVATTAIGKAAQGGTESFEAGDPEFEAHYAQISQNHSVGYVSSAAESFGDELINTAAHAGVEEGFFDGFVKKALSIGGSVVKHGLPVLVNALSNTESFDGAEAATPPALEGLAERAVLQEAALQAIMRLPPQQLQEEGFFDGIVDIVKKVAPVVIKNAPAVIKAVKPIVGAVVGGPARGARQPRGQGKKTLRKQKSVQMMKGAKEEGFFDKYIDWQNNGVPNHGMPRTPTLSVPVLY